MQVSLYHHQLTQQFVAHACPLRPHEHALAEVAGEQKTSKSARKTLNAGFRLATAHNSFDSSSRFTDARRRCLIFHMLRYTTQSSKIFEDLNFRGRGQGQGLENWSSRILEDKDVPRGQQHCYLCYIYLCRSRV